MFPGVISYQTNPKSYLSLPLSPTPLSSTLLGILSWRASACLPRPEPKTLGTECLVGSGSTQHQRAYCWKNLGRQAPSAQWHRTAWDMMAREGSRGPETGWSSTPQGPALPLTKAPLA